MNLSAEAELHVPAEGFREHCLAELVRCFSTGDTVFSDASFTTHHIWQMCCSLG